MTSVKNPLSLDDLRTGKNIPAEFRARFIAISRRYAHVYASLDNELPEPLNPAICPPHIIKLKKNYTPQYVQKPKYGLFESKYIRTWTDWALSEGLIEEAPNSAWACRLLLVAKRNPESTKEVIDGIRICGHLVAANTQIEKSVPTYNIPALELQNAAKHRLKFTADGLKQYWSCPLADSPGNRDVTTFWAPGPNGITKYRFTRCVMGMKNSAVVACNAYHKAKYQFMPKRSHDNLANFADDFCGHADTWEQLLTVYEDFLLMCSKANIHLKPSKTHFGHDDSNPAQFYGMNILEGRIEPATKHLDPIKKMTIPTSTSQLKSVMGVFNQFSRMIPKYGIYAPILNSMTSTKVQLKWTPKHEEEFQYIKQQLL